METRMARHLTAISVTALVVSLLALLVSVTALLQRGGTAVPVVAASPLPTVVPTRGVDSPEWLAVGTAIVKGRQERLDKLARGELVMFPNAPNRTFGPYLTEPMDITHEGDYALRAGPMRDDDDGPDLR